MAIRSSAESQQIIDSMFSARPVSPNPVAFESLPPADEQEGILPTAGRLGTAVLRGASKGLGEAASVVSMGKIDDQFLNVFGESQTTGEEIAETIGNFAVGFLPAIGVVGKVGKVAKVINAGSKLTKIATNPLVQSATAGAITDFAFFDEKTKRLSNIAEEHGIPFADILAQSDTDDEFVARLKSASEGILLGTAFDLLATSGKALFKANKLKTAGASPEQVAKALAEDPQISATAKALKEANEAEGVTTGGLVFKPSEAPQPTTAGVAPATGGPSVASGVQPLADPNRLPVGPRPDFDLKESALAVPRGTTPVSKVQLYRLFDLYENNKGTLALDDIRNNAPEVLTSIRSIRTAKDTEEWFGSFVGAFSEFLQNRKGGVIPDAVRSEKALEYLKNTLDTSGFENLLAGARASAQFSSQLPVLANAYQMALSTLNVATKTAVDDFLTEVGSFQGIAGTIRSLSEAPKSVQGLLQMLEVKKALSGYFKQIGSGAGRTLRVFRRINRDAQGFPLEANPGLAQAVNEILGPRLGSSNPLVGRSAQEVLNAVNSKGGLRRLEDLAMKLKLAGNDELAFSKIVDSTTTGLDRLATYTINALLSKPATFATLQLVANGLNSLYLPVERLTGSVFRGDLREAKNNLRILGYYSRMSSEATKWMIRSFKEGQSFISAGGGITAEQTGKKQVLGGIESLEKLSPTLGKALNGLDVLLTSPTRFMQAVDEGFKQIQVRAFASAHLHGEALEAGLKTPIEISKYVEDGLSKLISQDGALNSEFAIRGQARKMAKDQGLNKFDAYELEQRMVETWQPRMIRLERLADDFSKEATFTRQGYQTTRNGEFYVESGISGAISSIASRNPLVRILILPFVNTPMNVMKAVGQRLFPSLTINTPVLKGLHKQLQADLASGDPARIAAAEGRIIMGNLISTTALLASASGLITGNGPRDEQERKLLMQTGWQPMSIRIPTPEGDKYVSFAKVDPFASFFGLTADFLEAMSKADETKRGEGMELFAQSIALALSKNVINKTYLASLDQVVDMLQQPDRFAEKFLQSKAGAFVPGGIGALAPLFNNEEQAEIRSVSDAILAKIPGADGVESKRNLLGEKIRRNSPVLVDYFFPTALSQDKNDRLMSEISRLQHGFRNPSTKVNGIELLDYRLPNGQTAYDRYMELTGQLRVNGKTLRQSLEKLINSKAYSKLPDDRLFDVDKSPRISEIKKIINVYRKQARLELQKELPKLRTQFRLVERIREGRDEGRSVETLIQQLQGV